MENGVELRGAILRWLSGKIGKLLAADGQGSRTANPTVRGARTSKGKVLAALCLGSAMSLATMGGVRAQDYGAVSSYSYDTGGFCDEDGCPQNFWDYPIYYCPVFYRGYWYRGPFYYRVYDGEYRYWLQGHWVRERWRGPRPQWACEGRYGPPRGIDFYISHGFRWRDAWRERWYRTHPDHGGREVYGHHDRWHGGEARGPSQRNNWRGGYGYESNRRSEGGRWGNGGGRGAGRQDGGGWNAAGGGAFGANTGRRHAQGGWGANGAGTGGTAFGSNTGRRHAQSGWGANGTGTSGTAFGSNTGRHHAQGGNGWGITGGGKGSGGGSSPWTPPTTGPGFQTPQTGPAFQAPTTGPAFKGPQTGPAFQAPQAGPGFQAPKSGSAGGAKAQKSRSGKSSSRRTY